MKELPLVMVIICMISVLGMWCGTIEKIQRIMDSKDFDAWINILTPAYIQKVSDPTYLKEVSDEPSLKNNNIILTSIRDYFLFVFISSRSGVKMARIEFINQE